MAGMVEVRCWYGGNGVKDYGGDGGLVLVLMVVMVEVLCCDSGNGVENGGECSRGIYCDDGGGGVSLVL